MAWSKERGKKSLGRQAGRKHRKSCHTKESEDLNKEGVFNLNTTNRFDGMNTDKWPLYLTTRR